MRKYEAQLKKNMTADFPWAVEMLKSYKTTKLNASSLQNLIDDFEQRRFNFDQIEKKIAEVVNTCVEEMKSYEKKS